MAIPALPLSDLNTYAIILTMMILTQEVCVAHAVAATVETTRSEMSMLKGMGAHGTLTIQNLAAYMTPTTSKPVRCVVLVEVSTESHRYQLT